MSRGKYSPALTREMIANREFGFNCYGETPAEWAGGEAHDTKTMHDCYDSDGFDYYGYSAFDIAGNYITTGEGIDRAGYTEFEYLCMDDADFEYGCFDHKASFVRSRD
jgi:hypothetical protein